MMHHVSRSKPIRVDKKCAAERAHNLWSTKRLVAADDLDVIDRRNKRAVASGDRAPSGPKAQPGLDVTRPQNKSAARENL